MYINKKLQLKKNQVPLRNSMVATTVMYQSVD